MEVVFLGFIAALSLLVFRLTYLQWFQSRGFIAMANRAQGRKLEVNASRGRIQDRNGNEMAQDVMGAALAVNPRLVSDPEETAARLGNLLGLDERNTEGIRDRIERSKERKGFYCQLRRGVDRKLAGRIVALEGTEPALKGIWQEESPMRVNPSGKDGIQLLGTVNMDGKGAEAMELMFDKILTGTNGMRRVRVSATGKPIPETEERVVQPVDGKDVRLTIDRDIQHFVEQELANVGEEQNPDGAAAIVMDVHSGDVLAMANWPTYSPTQKKIRPEQRRNRAVTDLFEPGSIFKVITAAAALETGVNTHVYCAGARTIGNRTIHCAHGERHGSVDLHKMIEQSCNITAGTIAERIGPKRMYEFLDNCGFQKKTGIEFPGEEYGKLPPPDKWRTMRTVNIGFGQGVVVTPIQILSAYSAVANDGLYMPPRLVMDAPGARLAVRQPHRIMSERNAATLRSHMAAVVTSGTGKKAQLPGYSIAGKTGTAQIAKNGHYGHGYVASFVGFLPVQKPRLAILVSVWHPRRGQYGGTVSAPVFREIARHSVAYLKIPPDRPDELREADDDSFRRYVRNGADHSND